MTWEEIIIEIRNKPEFEQLVQDAYLGADLKANVLRFEKSLEFAETLKLLSDSGIQPGSKIIDIGAGNGIATLAFARKGFYVTAIEPDLSNTIGAGAITWLVKEFGLSNVNVVTNIAEDVNDVQPENDLVYIRQAVHHAQNLKQFVKNAVAMLKPGGKYLALRDHVIYNQKDKQWFLESHPLHKYYGGENAFTLQQYLEAMQQAGLTDIHYLTYYGSPLNYLPVLPESIEAKVKSRKELIDNSLKNKIGSLAGIPFIRNIYSRKVEKKLGPVLDESIVPGRPYTFIGTKQ